MANDKDKIKNITTYANQSNESSLTLDKLNEIIKTIEKIKTPVIYFTTFIPDDCIYKGYMIDRLLNCSKYEEGYLMHPRHKEILINYNQGLPFGGTLFIEREPQAINSKDSFEYKDKRL